MKTMIFRVLCVVSTLAIPSVGAADSYPRNLFAVAQMRVDSVRAPHGFEWYLKTREAQVILSSVAAYMGVDPAYVKLALDTIPTAQVKGEETFYALPVPAGYVFCAARIGVRSIVPASGDRASVISAGAEKNAVGVYTWTPVRHIGEGRSWAEADVQVMGVRPEYLPEFLNKGVCKEPRPNILECRGNPCAGVEHGSIQDTGTTTPDLTKGF